MPGRYGSSDRPRAAGSLKVGTERIPVRAAVIPGPERDELYARQVERRPGFADYERKATRKIPVIALEPVVEDAVR